MTGEPLLSGSNPALLRQQQGSYYIALPQSANHTLDSATDDHSKSPGPCRKPCRPQLGLHATTTKNSSATTGHGVQFAVFGPPLRHQASARMLPRILVKQAQLVGQDNQAVRLNQIGNQRPKGVVVAKPNLIGNNGIVFIDDWHYTKVQQGAQCASAVQISLTVRQIIMGQQNLRSMDVVPLELGFPRLHQPHLTNSCSGLKLMKLLGPNRPAQTTHPFRDGTRRNNHHLDAVFNQLCNLIHPQTQRSHVQATAIVGQQGASDLDNQASGLAQL
mmetsp:Transcript_41772/g.107855  ORF Transcript_41772/g.107855 Transcript_41772/m.107855 type:complete len:274 (-) Transcript_41772:435-1256(-)